MSNSGNGQLTDAGLKAQVKRLGGYPGYDDRKHELVRVLRKHVASDEHVERVITTILDTRRPNEGGFTSCPTPAEMIAYVAQVSADPTMRKVADKNCPTCGGSGWRITERGRVSGAEKCACTLS
jgi:hypothetical protein